MANYTPNYNLSKPENTDTQSDFISAYCDNMEIIDEHLGDGGTASGVAYDNTSSGLTATNVQDAIDEVVGDIPTKTSDLTNDSDFVSDANYVHTDNNFTSTEKSKLSGIASGAEVNVQSDWSQTDNTKDDFIKNKPTAENKSATTEFTTINGGLLQKAVIKLDPVQSGSGDPSPDNIRPISGHTEVGLQTAGKNLLRVTASSTTPYTVNDDGTILANGTSYGVNLIVGYVYPNGSTQYKLNGCPSGGGTSTYRLDARLVSTNAIITGSEDYGNGSTFTASEPFYIALRSPNAVVMSNVLFKPMVRFATESDSTYEPYLGHLYQVQIGSTVYGGYVDAVSGVMMVTYVSDEYDGSENWAIGASNDYGQLYYLTDVSPRYNNTITEICNWLPKSNNSSVVTPNGTTTGYSAGGNTLYLYFFVRFDLCADLNAWKTFLSNNPLQVAYRVATPTTINLTPQQIETLVGQNNLSCPLSGQTIDEVEYRDVFAFDDVQSVVNVRVPISTIGTDEFTSKASKAYSSGDYFYKDGYICKALTSIAKGATLTLNTNYSAFTLADILKLLSQ